MSLGVAAGLRPGLAALRRRDLPAVRGAVLAGVTVAAYLVPQVLAYAEVAGLAAVTGLWTAVAALGVYAVLRVLAAALGRPRVRTSEDHEHTSTRIWWLTCGNTERPGWGRVTTRAGPRSAGG